MRAVLPGRPPPKLQALSTALWDGVRIVAYISGHALVILGGVNKLLQTIYTDDDADPLEAVVVDEASGRIAVAVGPEIAVYQPYSFGEDNFKWSLSHSFRSPDDDEPIKTLSWGSVDELLVGNSRLTLWLLSEDTPRIIWTKQVANLVKFAQFSADAELIASTGQYDRVVKIWRRLTFGTEDVRFDISYLPHSAAVTNIHWRQLQHRDQSMENVLYTTCADNKIRVWAVVDKHNSPTALQLWTEIDMESSIQPRHPIHGENAKRRYGLIVDSRDFSAATERAVQRGGAGEENNNHALERLVEVATKSPEICIVLDDRGHMSAWGLENVGCKVRSASNVFNICHVEGLRLSFEAGARPAEDYARFYGFGGGVSEDSFTILVHYFDGRIEWFDSKVDALFDPSPRHKRLKSKGVWSGHSGSIKKIVRNPSGKFLVSRTNDNRAMIWRQTSSARPGSALVRHSELFSDEHIHRTCIIGEGGFLVNLHHSGISIWDTRSFHAKMLAKCDFQLSSKPLCVLHIPTAEESSVVYIAAVGADMTGIAWELHLPKEKDKSNGAVNGTNGAAAAHHRPVLQQFCTFNLGVDEDVSYILPIDPAGSQVKVSGFLDLFATDIAVSYTHSGVIRTWTAKVDTHKRKLDWLWTSSVDTGIANPSLASGTSMRKTAMVDQDRTRLTIWDTNGAQLEFEERFPQQDIIKDLDWTSTPDVQSILAVGFPFKVVLLSQLRYDYLDAGPSWAQIREIRIRDITPHPIGDSCWLGNGNLVVGAGNQLFVYDKHLEATHPMVAGLRLAGPKTHYVDLFEVVGRLNGSLPVFHPQFLAQCILSGKMNLVHLILTSLHRKLKFFTEGDEIDGFLEIPLEKFYMDADALQKVSWKEINSSYADFTDDIESTVVDEALAVALNENLTRVALPQLSSKEQFRLVDTIECVATVEKHRRSMDDNAARYLLFFRQHMLRKSQGLAEQQNISWREIVWAFHSGSHEILVDLVSKQFQGKMLWEHARDSGLFMWIDNVASLRNQLEIIARNEYTKSDEKNPIDCSLYYLALGKKNVLQGLWRMASWNREQAATLKLMGRDFKEQRWKTAALKNAYALLGKRRFEYAAAFFLLGESLRDAVQVCMNQMNDIQLAVTIARVYEGGDDGPVLREILEDRILVDAATEGNRWMATWAFWLLNRRDMAVRALISPVDSLIRPTPTSPPTPGQIALSAKSYLSNDPALVVLYKQLRAKTLQTLTGATKVPARDEWDFVLRNARLYDRMGCDLLALNLVRDWEFLTPMLLPTPRAVPHHPPPPVSSQQQQQQPKRQRKKTLSIELSEDNAPADLRKLLRRRRSLVVADMPILTSPVMVPQDIGGGGGGGGDGNSGGPVPVPAATGGKGTPTVFHEPDSSSLLDSFGF
ncbi:hypothetical protein AJ80_08125 [Polytolypa hystricis UAMH7299]|uniref:RAVE complex protein Rav1 C-terminal domain-containing protein n=1 Tax=Polytolypa hystricis (strain UAMH7299) TaxID=1447883 RepID=A0A2B7XDH7_POLH7|nr:hypothetical protein AJ80_08125 [Polytolypa hystricis UAMH7299]